MQTIQAEPREAEMRTNYQMIERNAEALAIDNDDDYEAAAEYVTGVKTQMNEVKEYYRPMKEAAHKTHAEICAKEKQLMEPLVNAEKYCKAAMSAYLRRKQEIARQQEAEMRRLAEAEAEAQLQKAIEAEEAGNADAAEVAMQMATVADQIKDSAVVAETAPKVSGIGASKDFEIVSIDPRLVPIAVGGVELRPVDDKAVLRLIKAHKGQIDIPGVTFRETFRMSVSGRRF